MWNCDFGLISRGLFSGNIGSLLIWGLIVFLVVYLAIRCFKPRAENPQEQFQDRIDSISILKSRFARGEISQDEFLKMKQILSQP